MKGPVSSFVLCFLISFTAAKDYGGFRIVNQTAVPSKYAVNFNFPEGIFNDDSFNTFSGVVKITFQVTEKTSQIQINAATETSSFNYRLMDGNQSYSITKTDLLYNSTSQILRISSPVPLVPSKDYILGAEYNLTNITSEPKGIFRTKVTNFETNKSNYILATNFRGVLSRWAFPSFDEPLLKAKFLLTITAPQGLTVVGPTTANSSFVLSGIQTVTFQETPITSTFALGFVIGNFHCNTTSSSGVQIGVCSKFNTNNQRSFPLNLASQIVESLSNITGLRYSKHASKLDIVALPGDFIKGGVTSYGLVLLADHELLTPENNSESSVSQVIQNGINLSTAIARHWFATLVTPEWWDYNYLGAGFGILYGYGALYRLDVAKEWHTDTRFYTHEIAEAFILDSENDTLPLASVAATPEEIEAKFSAHVAKKAASILYMAKNIVGSKNFLDGVSYLLNNFALSGGPDAALWAVLANYTSADRLPANVSLATVMANWTNEKGYPILNQYRINISDVELFTYRYTYSGWYKQPFWYLPLAYTLANDTTNFDNTNPKLWLGLNETFVWADLIKESKWELFNNQWAGFFRGVPDQFSILPQIRDALKANTTALEVNTRAQLISDYLNFARGGQLWYSSVLNFTEYLVNETKYNPWYVFLNDIALPLKRFGPGSFAYDALLKYVDRLLENRWKDVSNLTLTSTDVKFNLLQELVVGFKCTVLGEVSCVSQAKRIFEHHKNNGTAIPANLRHIIKLTALKYSDEPENDFDFLWEKFLNSTDALEKHQTLALLGRVNNETVIKKLLNYTLDEHYNIRGQEFALVWRTVASNQISGTETALSYFTTNYSNITAKYDRTDLLIEDLADYIYREDQISLISKLVKSGKLSNRDVLVANTVSNTIKENLGWAALQSDDVYQYIHPFRV